MSKDGACPPEKHIMVTLVLATQVMLSWKGLPWTSTLAYLSTGLGMQKKKFYSIYSQLFLQKNAKNVEGLIDFCETQIN